MTETLYLANPRCRPDKASRRQHVMIATAILGLAIACGTGPPASTSAVDRSSRVDDLFAAFAEGVQPGVAAMVIEEGEIVHAKGYGYADLEHRTEITPNTSIRLGSVSKQFTCMGIMILAESGKLDYDDPASDYIPELADRYGDQITIRNLMHHTSGLPDYYEELEEFAGYEVPGYEDGATVFGRWGTAIFSPGERYEYSNPAYEMLALIVERVSGTSFADFIDDNIFGPLEMNGAVAWDHPDKVIPNRAFAYSPSGDGFELDDDHQMNWMLGAGGIYASLQDMYRWDQALYSEDLVSSDTLQEAFTPARLNNHEETGYGFGWGISSYNGHRRVSHNGSWVGFRTTIARHPDAGLTIVLLSNRSDFDPAGHIDPIADIYLTPLSASGRVDRLFAEFAEPVLRSAR